MNQFWVNFTAAVTILGKQILNCNLTKPKFKIIIEKKTILAHIVITFRYSQLYFSSHTVEPWLTATHICRHFIYPPRITHYKLIIAQIWTPFQTHLNTFSVPKENTSGNNGNGRMQEGKNYVRRILFEPLECESDQPDSCTDQKRYITFNWIKWPSLN